MIAQKTTAGCGSLLVCGGAVVDCIVRPFDSSQRGASRTSMPGQAKISHGGVGRNIAEVATRLGGSVRLLSAVGSDEPGNQLLHHCQDLGIGVEDVVKIGDGRTATYTALLDGGGELVGAVADMAVFDALRPEAVGATCCSLDSVTLLVCDANLSSDVLQEVLQRAQDARVPAWFEPVSVAKAGRGRLRQPWHLAAPNWDELLSLMGLPPTPLAAGKTEALPAQLFEAMGEALGPSALAENLLVSLGPQGCVLGSSVSSPSSASSFMGKLEIHVANLVECAKDVPPLAIDVQKVDAEGSKSSFLWYRLLRPLESVTDVTGAGDALLAGTAAAFVAGWALEEAVLAGLLAAHLTLFVEGGVAPSLQASLLAKLRMEFAGQGAGVRQSRL